MTLAVSACPGCAATPLAQTVADTQAAQDELVISLPGIHCAGCISGVERVLNAMPGVHSARVNLTSKRVTVAATGVEPEDIVTVLTTAGYEAHPLDRAMLVAQDTDDAGRALLLKVAVAGFAMMNVMMFSIAVWSGASQSTLSLFHWISAAIALPALAFSAQVFFRSAAGALRAHRLNMDVPISLAIILAAGLSVYETMQASHHVYFDAALSLTFFLLVGRYLDHRTRFAAKSASQELSALEVPRAIRITETGRKNVDVADLVAGDMIMVVAGMRVPVDGTVLDGTSELDRSMLTGESLPVSVRKGESISAGDLNITAPLTLKVTATGADTTLRRMAAMIERAECARNRYTALADRAAQIYAPAVHLLALVTFIGWFTLSADAARALQIAISVLIITCPCALGLAAPAVITAASGRLFRRGLLIKDATALERLAEVDTVVFDKTGTLTIGQAQLDTSTLSDGTAGILAALCHASNHPVSRAIADALPDGTKPAKLENIREHPGQGIEATWNGRQVRLGRADWTGAQSSPAFRIDGQPAIPLSFVETPKDGTAEMLQTLADAGLDIRIFSGDTPQATARLTQQIGGWPATGNMTPDDKHAAIDALTDQGRRVLMVGDGLNDTAALTRAHASISPGTALDASRAASDVVVLGQTLAEIPEAISVSKQARQRILENFCIAAAYNAVAIPIAIAGYASPLGAAIAMSASSITVLLNALRVR